MAAGSGGFDTTRAILFQLDFGDIQTQTNTTTQHAQRLDSGDIQIQKDTATDDFHTKAHKYNKNKVTKSGIYQRQGVQSQTFFKNPDGQ